MRTIITFLLFAFITFSGCQTTSQVRVIDDAFDGSSTVSLRHVRQVYGSQPASLDFHWVGRRATDTSTAVLYLATSRDQFSTRTDRAINMRIGGKNFTLPAQLQRTQQHSETYINSETTVTTDSSGTATSSSSDSESTQCWNACPRAGHRPQS